MTTTTLAVHRNRGTADIDKLRDTAEGHESDAPDAPDGEPGADGAAHGQADEKAEATA